MLPLPGASPAGAASSPTPPSGRPAGGPWGAADTVAGSLLVTVQTPTSDTWAARVRDRGLPALRQVSRLSDRVLRVDVTPGREAAAAAALLALDGVVAVEPDRRLEFTAVPDDELFAQQWAHTLTGVGQAWDRTTGSSDVVVAVLDSGVDARHPELGGVVEQVDASTGSILPGTLDNDRCAVGHGTWVAGVVGAEGNDVQGVAGVNWQVSIVDVSLTSPDGDCRGPSDSAVIAALDYVAGGTGRRVDIVNMSFGGVRSQCPAAYATAIADVRGAGITLVASAGNGEADPQLAGRPSVPASCDGVISVGAVGRDGSTASYSTANQWVDLTAPGGDPADGRDPRDAEALILTTARGGGTEGVAGTSFSAPYVSGVAALLLAADPALAPDDIEAVLEATAEDLGPVGRDRAYGWGLVQAGAAMQRVGAGDIPALQPDPDFPVGSGAIDVDVLRLAGASPTEAVRQAVAISRAIFDDRSAPHAVVARMDDYADALAGSSLGYGLGPLLFTATTGPLAAPTRTELQRVLQPGATVYLMGGPAALPASLEGELRQLGFVPVRFAGAAREDTAALAGREMRQLVARSPFPDLDAVVVATRGDWPDAVAAGSLGAHWGMPVLLTAPETLHPATRAALGEFAPATVYVVGGTAVLSEAVESDLRTTTGAEVTRLSGPTRTGTAVAVAAEMERLLDEKFGIAPGVAVALNFRRRDGFAHVLSASALAGAFGGVFVPVEEDGGTVLTDDVQEHLCGLGIDGVLAGGSDVVADPAGVLLEQLLENTAPACGP